MTNDPFYDLFANHNEEEPWSEVDFRAVLDLLHVAEQVWNG